MGMLTNPDDCSRMVNLLPSQFSQNSFVKCCYGDEEPPDTPDDNPSDNIMQDQRCPGGYTFNDILNVCDDIDECYEETHTCDPMFERCINNLGDYFCEPILESLMNIGGDDNETNVVQCPDGYKYFLISCIDVDECSDNLHNCSSNQICENTEGSFECTEANADLDSVIKCPRGYSLDPLTNQCLDINECATGTHNCNEESQRCDNTLGSYTCVR